MTKSVLVTGAAGGIGQAICAIFQQSGWSVIASDKEAMEPENEMAFVKADLLDLVQDPKAATKFASKVEEHLEDGRLHALINNAAYMKVAPFEELQANDFLISFQINVLAPAVLARHFLNHLKAASGSVINISSIHAQQTKEEFCAYATSKAALEGLTRAMAVELGHSVRVNAISPAAVRTSMLEAGFIHEPEKMDELASYHPSGTIGEPESIAHAALYLAEPRTHFLNGAILTLDGGISLRLHDPA